MKNIFRVSIVSLLLIPTLAFAHQPRIVKSNFVEVKNPEISQAFYDELKGQAVDYRINSLKDFRLYVGLLVPDVPNIEKNISAEIYKLNMGEKEPIATLDGSNFTWTPFYEEFAKDNYFSGPEYNALESQKGVALKGKLMPSGDYHIMVYNPTNQGKYVFVVGDIESFPLGESLKSLLIVPQLKLYFFNEPITQALHSAFVWGPLLAIFILAIILSNVYRWTKGRKTGNFKGKE